MIPRTCLEVPHAGALCRVEHQHAGTMMTEAFYVVEIAVDEGTHELSYTRKDFEFTQRLFAILDTESRGLVDRPSVKEFVTLRCPVFWRRDEDLKRLQLSESDSPTFDEIWNSVVFCSRMTGKHSDSGRDGIELGVEGWMVFCRFVALAQYLEGKRRFSARHLQQTMRHRNSPRGSEVVVVDVPPPDPPSPLSARQLASYENQSQAPLPLPELDLDHSMVAAHDSSRMIPTCLSRGHVKISLLGSPTFSSHLLTSSGASNSNNHEFAVTCVRRRGASSSSEETLVRRSMADLKWLDDTFAAHKVLGGTLCGRILPPFPPMQSDESVLNTSLKTTGGAITAVAASGVGRIRNAAKSLIGNYLATGKPGSTDESQRASKKLINANSTLGFRVYPESYYNPYSPSSRAHHIERYLNYLLEHPALSTSFPLNTILKASQSGLEAAKESLEVVARTTKEIKDQTPHLDDGKISIPFWPSGCSGSDSSLTPNLAWVRTAAQAAMALQVHGMLETTGMNSASARLQHASLPSFGPASRSAGREDDEAPMYHRGSEASRPIVHEISAEGEVEASNFEDGVVSVHSELAVLEPDMCDDGYDLLPLPVPAPERRILSAGNDSCSATFVREGRFHYGPGSVQNDVQVDVEDKSNKAFLGDIAVDENIGKLREVIGSVENTLSRCLASVGAIAKSQRERQVLHMEVVRGLDSWSGMRGKFVSQRSLLKGVAGIEQCKEIYVEGDVSMIDDISWQNSLAKSAVSAAEDVRSAVRVSRTATNAKSAAHAAAFAAQNACDTFTFSSIDEARAAQTRASIAHSHAIHAAVVEHEAKTVMRRSTLALAHDVKVWNVHRKREMLQSCVAYSRSQHEATRRAVDAWSSLRDGFIGTTVIPSAQERRPMSLSSPPAPPSTRVVEPRQPATLETNEVTATILTDNIPMESRQTPIVAVDHHILSNASVPHDATKEPKKDLPNLLISCPLSELMIPPFATAAPIPEEDEDEQPSLGGVSSGMFKDDRTSSRFLEHDPDTSGTTEDGMSSSMQSLIDGLMAWGGSAGMDTEEDHFALPSGMAASIAFGGRSRSSSDASPKMT